MTGVDAGMDAAVDDPATRILASGGCGPCSVRGARGAPTDGLAFLVGALGLAAWWRRRRRGRS
jgi:MYXO-CTERM domain-containing protein